MQVTSLNGIKVYNLSAGKKLPEWLSEQQRRKLNKTDESFRRRIQLLQDFDFPVASHQIRVSKDGNYVAAVGVYPPQVKVFDVRELSMKFERHMDCEVVQFEMIAEDYRKMAFLQADRTIELHASYGTHFKTRIPKVGRDMAYHAPTAELYVVGSTSDIYRLNLEEGRFMAPLTSQSNEVNAIHVAPYTSLIGTAGTSGVVEIWDPRSRSVAGRVDVGPPINGTQTPSFLSSENSGGSAEATTLRFDDSGLGLAVGTSDGRVQMYDMRSRVPLLTKEHQYGLPIVDVKFHRGSGGTRDSTVYDGADSYGTTFQQDNHASSSGEYVVSADSRIIKIWDRSDGKILTNIEPQAPVNSICLVKTHSGATSNKQKQKTMDANTMMHDEPENESFTSSVGADSGLLLVAGERERVLSYYIPTLGVAPRWCSFLDSLTEELEEGKDQEGSVFADYKFITRDELTRLGLGHLIGTPLLRAYMHGFFMDIRLYNKVQAVADPLAYDKWRKEQIKKKLDEKRANRITIQNKLPKVNQALAQSLLEKSSRRDDKNENQDTQNMNPIQDNRFAKLFSDPAFEIDPTKAPSKQSHSRHEKDEDEEANITESDNEQNEAPMSYLFDLIEEETKRTSGETHNKTDQDEMHDSDQDSDDLDDPVLRQAAQNRRNRREAFRRKHNKAEQMEEDIEASLGLEGMSPEDAALFKRAAAASKAAKTAAKSTTKRSRGPAKSIRFFEAKDGIDATETAASLVGRNASVKKHVSHAKTNERRINKSLGSRIAKQEERNTIRKQKMSRLKKVEGGMQSTFTPRYSDKTDNKKKRRRQHS